MSYIQTRIKPDDVTIYGKFFRALVWYSLIHMSIMMTLITYDYNNGLMENPDWPNSLGGDLYLMSYIWITVIYFPIFILLLITFFMWIYRYAAYFQQYIHLKNSPGWSVGWWFVPIMNLGLPLDILSDLWQAGSPVPHTPYDKQQKFWMQWWLLYLGSNAVSNFLWMASENEDIAAADNTMITFFIIAVYLCQAALFHNLTSKFDARLKDHAALLQYHAARQPQPPYAQPPPQQYWQ